jgi:hypothetical protein
MSEKYYQFPLSLLANTAPEGSPRLHAIVSHCVVSLGLKTIEEEELDEFALVERVERLPRDKWPKAINTNYPKHQAILLGYQILGVVGGDALQVLRQWESCEETIADMKNNFGASPLVRVRHDIMWDAIKGNGIDWRQFSVLCAVYSTIGSDEAPHAITNNAIRARAMGYKKASILFEKDGFGFTREGEALLYARKAKPLSRSQVRYTLDQLEERGFFARCEVNRRRTLFSHRMTSEEMRDWALKNPPAEKVAARKAADRLLRARIAAKSSHSVGHSNHHSLTTTPLLPPPQPSPLKSPQSSPL